MARSTKKARRLGKHPDRVTPAGLFLREFWLKKLEAKEECTHTEATAAAQAEGHKTRDWYSGRARHWAEHELEKPATSPPRSPRATAAKPPRSVARKAATAAVASCGEVETAMRAMESAHASLREAKSILDGLLVSA
jgi:hypothetical protein